MGWLYVFDVDGKKLAVFGEGDPVDVNKKTLDTAHATIKSIYPQAKFLYYTYVRNLVEHGPRHFLAKARFQTWILDEAKWPIWKIYKKEGREGR